MKRYAVGQKFWDEKNCREIEILKFNGIIYYCETVSEGASDDEKGTLEYQWFSMFELDKFTRI